MHVKRHIEVRANTQRKAKGDRLDRHISRSYGVWLAGPRGANTGAGDMTEPAR